MGGQKMTAKRKPRYQKSNADPETLPAAPEPIQKIKDELSRKMRDQTLDEIRRDTEEAVDHIAKLMAKRGYVLAHVNRNLKTGELMP
jgi:hypothetical protein